ncbi:unnamed protein product [Caenorhabditis auriculariae]|uniref:Cyclin-like domain-containing protein n=1 Tax=Caenorhabditis auriculariae TaxID=2777116 RepID=A0A8S1GXG7_9PELO|nr:unnamed protein product [Caenorhabditis auriculariae]
MLSASSSTGTINERSGVHKWIFSNEEMQQAASIVDGYTLQEELTFRQQAASFIQEMGEMLNHGIRDRGRTSLLGLCIANIHMHRFFYFHSFKRFDYRDVAAACLLLSGKSEECPRKLSHIVKVWWGKKFPMVKSPPSGGVSMEAEQYLVTLENLVLQTIAFDINIMNDLDKGGLHKKITAVAYYFATDILCVMNWTIRFSSISIAVACIHIVCIYADFKIATLRPSDVTGEWYSSYDKEMTKECLTEMSNEFMQVYKSCSHLHLASLKQLEKHRLTAPSSSAQVRTEESTGGVLPPPPAAPSFNSHKKVHSETKQMVMMENSPRPGFNHELNNVETRTEAQKVSAKEEKKEGKREIVEEKTHAIEVAALSNGKLARTQEEERKRRDRRKHEERDKNSVVQHRERNDRDRHYVRDMETSDRLEKERLREEERRKREHDRIAGRTEFHATHASEKRARLENLSSSFVPASNGACSRLPLTTSSASTDFSTNQTFPSRDRESNGDKAPRPMPLSSNSYRCLEKNGHPQLATMTKRPERPLSPPNAPVLGRFDPKPPLSPLPAPPSLLLPYCRARGDLEDGELE